ncbi:MAG: hypothetical protein IKI22_02825 [Neisseriaceae bacterium]|nr:hypothetical protein [Neisseriaceae bacterium]
MLRLIILSIPLIYLIFEQGAFLVQYAANTIPTLSENLNNIETSLTLLPAIVGSIMALCTIYAVMITWKFCRSICFNKRFSYTIGNSCGILWAGLIGLPALWELTWIIIDFCKGRKPVIEWYLPHIISILCLLYLPMLLLYLISKNHFLKPTVTRGNPAKSDNV